MNSVRLVNDVGNTALWAGVILLTVFLVQYSVLARWWKDPIGRTVVFLDVVVLALLFPSFIGQFWPSWSFLHDLGYVQFEDVILILIALGMGWRIAVWQREAIRNRRNR